MIEPKQANELSKQAVCQYIKQCDCKTTQDLANVLTMLISMTAIYMHEAAGKQETIFRIGEITQFVESLKVSEGAPPKIH